MQCAFSAARINDRAAVMDSKETMEGRMALRVLSWSQATMPSRVKLEQLQHNKGIL